MSLIARCTACQTSYRVVPDQLRVSDGWVRCGQCGEIFDATQQSVDTDTEQSVADPRVSADGFFKTHPLVPDDMVPRESPRAFPEDFAVKQQAFAVPASHSQAHQEASNEFSAPGLPWASAALLIKPSSDSEFKSESESMAEKSVEPALSSPEATASFMLAPDVSSGDRHRLRPVLWWGLGVTLLFSLLFQGLYRERDQLASFAPQLKPALQAFCDVLDCRVSPVQHIEDLVIDSAEFHQVGQETFELRFVVKNKARFELALPAIELTLTDMADRPVLRRVLTPAELGGANVSSVVARRTWSAPVYLRVGAEAAGLRALGYRLLVFYP